MAVHNFNYTFEFVSIQATQVDDYKIINQATVKITGVDRDDDTQEASSIETVYFCPFDKVRTLPNNDFTDLDDVTENQVVAWVRESYEDHYSLDTLFTHLVYGPDELNPPESEG